MAKVTFESVAQAAESLMADQAEVSVRGIQRELGKIYSADGSPFGSPNVILPFLREWRSGRRPISASDIALDESISLAIIRQMKKVAGDAAAAAETRATAAEQDMQASIEAGLASEQRIEELTVEVETLRASLNKSVALVETLRADFEKEDEISRKKIIEWAEDCGKERDRANAALQELGKAQARAEAVPALEATIAKLQADLDAERTARAAAEQRAAVADAQVKLVSEQAEKASVDADKQISGVKAAADKADQAHAEAVAQLRRDLQDARSEVREAAQKLDAARAQVDLLHEQLAAASKAGTIDSSKPKEA